jgi:hypothetical protein
MNYTIEKKENSYGRNIYTAVPPKGEARKMKYPIGWFPTEEEAVEAFEKAINA